MSRGLRSLIGSAALVFAFLFTVVGGGQYWFLRWQLNKQDTIYLEHSANDLRDQISFTDHWDLVNYRRTPWPVPEDYIVMAQNGTLIDQGGNCLNEMNIPVSLPFAPVYDHPVHFKSDVGEEWDLYLHKLSDGIVVLGSRREVSPKNIDTMFASDAPRFGASVKDALNTKVREIDEPVEYAIIDRDGILRNLIGEIPLKASPPAIPAKPTLGPNNQIENKTYAVFLNPVLSKSGRAVGLISVYTDVTDEQLLLRRSAFFNSAVSALLWIITVISLIAYLRPVRPSTVSCAQIPFLDEDQTVEFKSSLRWDYQQQKPNKDLERVIAKTVAGFMNSETGGTLIIGMSDSKEVLGLQADYATFKNVKPDRDGFEQALRQSLIAALGERRCVRWVKMRFCSMLGKELCVVTVAPSSEPVFLEGEAGGQLFVRVGNSTRPLDTKEALAYARDRWGHHALPKWRAHRAVPNPAV